MSKFLLVISTICMMVCCVVACSSKQTAKPAFITVKDGKFIKNGTPYYYVGANLWYGAILASTGEGGNRERLHKELDLLKENGVNNLRILVGADGSHGVTAKVEPTLQIEPGVYNDTILEGLDYLLVEMNKRDMVAILYLNNSWEWSGGYSMYLEWAGYGKGPIPRVDGWLPFRDFVKQFPQSEKAKALFAGYVNDMVTRTNRFTGVKYVDDPTIMSWQVSNEPRAFAYENKEVFAKWMSDVSAQIRSLDKNHLISTGSEGKYGCEGDMELFERIHADANIDYMNIHIWPYNWGWAPKDSLAESLPLSKENTRKYIDEHLAVAARYNKPIVLEEFGFPRDGFQFTRTSTTASRDDYYAFVLDRVVAEAEAGSLLAGCNFWAWGGIAKLSDTHVFWQKGDDYTGDPAQEEQGLYSVFSTDTTLPLIKSANDKLKNLELSATSR